MSGSNKENTRRPGNPYFGKGQPPHYCGKPGRSGPRPGHTNGIRHGLVCGKLPKDSRYIEVRSNVVRRALEAEILRARGEITVADAALVSAAMKWLRHGQLAQRWLRVEGDKLTLSERLNFSREVARAGSEVSKAIAALDLASSESSVWDVVALPPSSSPENDGDDKSSEQQGNT